MGVLGRTGDVIAVGSGHVLELLKSLDLLSVLLAETSPVLREGLADDGVLVLKLLRNQVVNTVQSHAAVVTDNTATTIGVRQTGDDVAGTSRTNVGGVDVENGIVVGLAVLGEDLLHSRVVFLACFVNSGLNHAPAAIGHHGTLEGAVSL